MSLIYTKKVMNRFLHPKFFKKIKKFNGKGTVGNSRCGDIMEVFINVENKKIKDISFQTYGCTAAIASSDALCEVTKGKTIEQALKITNKDILNVLGEVPSIKVHCSVLGSEALKTAIYDYFKKSKKPIPESLEIEIKRINTHQEH